MAAFLNACRFNPTLGGTTDWTYASAVAGYNSPALAGAVNGRVYKYRAESADLSQWEMGEGAYNSGTGVFARTTVLYNSAGTGTGAGQSGAGDKISFSTVPQVAIVALKEDLLAVEEANAFTAAQRSQGRKNLGSAIDELQNVTFAVSAGSSALTIALKDASGADATSATPIALSFRNASLTASPNTPTTVEVTAASSLVLSSGSTLGVTSSTAFRLWIVGFNDGGTFRLGVIKCASGLNVFPLPDHGIASSTAEGGAGAADSAGVIYTGTAVTSKAYRILGYVDWTASGLTAGTWTTTNLNSIQTFGAGIKTPGDVVQSKYAAGAQFSTTSTSYVDTNTTVAITPTSAANLIKFATTGPIQILAAAGCQAFVRMYRGSTAVGEETQLYNNATLANIISAAALIGMDAPNSVASTTYVARLRGTPAPSTAVRYPAADSAAIVVDEIMV